MSACAAVRALSRCLCRVSGRSPNPLRRQVQARASMTMLPVAAPSPRTSQRTRATSACGAHGDADGGEEQAADHYPHDQTNSMRARGCGVDHAFCVTRSATQQYSSKPSDSATDGAAAQGSEWVREVLPESSVVRGVPAVS